MEDHDAADPPLRTLNVFYQGTNVEMLEETYFKFKKNIIPKMKKMQPNFQQPVVEYCEPDQVIDICSYSHYPVLDKSSQKQEQHNDDNDIYDTSELEHEFEYGIYEDVFKTEQLMADLKRIDEAEKQNKKLRDVQFEDFPLEQFSDAGRVANEGDPQLKAAADTELYDLEKRALQIDIDKHEYDNSSENTDDNSSPRADDNSSPCADDSSSPHADAIPAHVLMIIPAEVLMIIPAKELKMMMIYNKLKLVTCNYLQSARNTMLIMMIIHCKNWFTDQCMCHTMKTARKYCCRKQQICHEKTISNCYIIHYPRVCAIINTKA